MIQSLTRGATSREDLRPQLDRFYELLSRAVETGDFAWLDSILIDWSNLLPQSDRETGPSSIAQILREMMTQTVLVCRETYDGDQALILIGEIIPPFAYMMENAASAELQARTAVLNLQLEQTKLSLEKLDKKKSDFVAVAAHELKTPLTLIEGYSAMLKEIYDKGESQSTEALLLNGIFNGARRLKGIIDDMIDVSLIDNKLLSLNFQPVWLNRMLAALENELNPVISERRQVLQIIPFPGSNEVTFGDPERLIQLFRNILINAVKFTPDGGRIVVDGRKLPGFLEVTVSDTGIGIDPDDQSIVFEKFTSIGDVALHSSGKTKFKGGGPGLGLHIAKGIIEAHGGAIWVESPGHDEKACPGSTFHIMLPLRSQPSDERMAKLLEPFIQSNLPNRRTQ